MDQYVITLPNGIRIIFKPFSSPVSHACIVINAGTRDESPQTSGLAHFIEHLLFKKTERRNTSQILNRLESIGADLNAYTTKEYTCIHASFLQAYLDRTLDLFEDLVFHSVYPDEELEKEKSVILDEIASYQDLPEDAINDDFEELLFAGHPLGRNILGTAESVSRLSRQDIFTFLQEHYTTNQMVIGISGNYSPSRIEKLAQRYFAHLPATHSSRKREPVAQYMAQTRKESKPISQVHCVIGAPAYNLYHENKTGLLLLNNMLGGNGMSSRLNLQIREKYGIAYTIDSNYTPLTDTGIFSIYFGTDAEKSDKALRLIYRELKKLCEHKLGTLQLHTARQKFIGQIALAEENRIGMIISMAKSLLDYNRVDTLDEIFARIQACTASQLQDIANEIFNPSALSVLLFQPESQ
ncbi:insulinase family protein (plasmid) [Pedobacter sp. BS3]|uniref:M16 family metallopeptidase n=1 Tax=Pedobacter sp. BS3 TaxID=2567937 RepID=UPI0011EF6EA9|nr:pitrilysin family protein [Pedobacter sp. BS3]TZF86128.1 insulinase family protein [Pedobacter sp. BS3]